MTTVRAPKALVLGLRDLLHFAVAYAAAFGAAWVAAGSPTTKAALLAIAPGVAVVLFRQLVPNFGRITSALSKTAPLVAAPVDPTTRSLP